MTEPSFVRALPAGGDDAEPLTLSPEVRAELVRELAELRRARDMAWVTGQNYVIT